ncbi:MAG: trehalose-6-phosphate synthase [Chloroflexota bacterium]|nr:trehalose-6-phosphate synthase [Chloroflexota bacterium]
MRSQEAPRTKTGDQHLGMDRLVIVSNRLPVAITKGARGQWQVEPAVGGLVSALAPLLRERSGLWIGWPGNAEEADLGEPLARASRSLGYELQLVPLSREETDRYYQGFSNEILWPLFHDLQTLCRFDPAYWNSYQSVNRKFARAIAERAGPRDYVWVHDYHLMLVARELRSMGLERKLGFFLHTPFPPADIYFKLPWRSQILAALLDYDLIGFQTLRDRNNFVHCVTGVLKGYHVDARRQVTTIKTSKREVQVGSFPIGIEYKEYRRQAASSEVTRAARLVRTALPNRKIVLGVDRLDYSKGIPEKLRAFGNALDRFDDLRGKVSLVQVVVPSREAVLQYRALRDEIEGLVGEINGKFTRLGWVPVHYMFRSLERTELLAYYRAADIALITSLKDGMNLVAKEYCAANIDRSGVLILSEFAGAADQLRRNSLLVNPYDSEGVANAIQRAYHMGVEERQRRMRRLQVSVQKRNVFWWVDFYLRTATGKGVDESLAP